MTSSAICVATAVRSPPVLLPGAISSPGWMRVAGTPEVVGGYYCQRIRSFYGAVKKKRSIGSTYGVE